MGVLEMEVPASIVNAISNMVDQKQQVISTQSRLLPDDTITSRKVLKEKLKSGEISGSCLIEWSDEQGKLRTNVIDFLTESQVGAVDPDSGEKIMVKTKDLPDDSWRLLH